MERYERNLLLDNIDELAQKKINSMRVLVVGVGGLGSAVLVNLASIGIENFGLVDFDVVSVSNLNRQYVHSEKTLGIKKVLSAKTWLEGYNSKIKVEGFDIKLDISHPITYHLSLITNYDIIVDCLDNWESKFLLEKICQKLSKPLVHGGVEGFRGQVMTILPNSKKLSDIFNFGEKVEIFRGIISPIVSVIGALQAKEVLNLILGEKVLSDEILMYDIDKNEIKRISL